MEHHSIFGDFLDMFFTFIPRDAPSNHSVEWERGAQMIEKGYDYN